MIFGNLFNEDSEELMDALSERYKGYESDFWAINKFEVVIDSLDEARIYCYKKDGDRDRRINMRRNKIDKIMNIPLSFKIDSRMFFLKMQLKHENKNTRKLIDLKNRYLNINNKKSNAQGHNGSIEIKF